MPARATKTKKTPAPKKSAAPAQRKLGVAATGKRKQVDEERVEVIEQKPDGTRLVRALNQRMAVLGMTPVDVARTLDMSYSYFITLANDPSRFAGINRRFMRNIARFLGVNTIMAYQYAGFFEDEDINVDVTVDTLLEKSRDNMEHDPVYGFYVPEVNVWRDIPLQVRLLMHFMYSEIELARPKLLLLQEELKTVPATPPARAKRGRPKSRPA